MDRADPDLDKYVAMSSPLKHRALLVRRKADTRGVLFKAYQVASTSKVLNMGHMNQLTWMPAANIPSPLK